MEIISKRKTRKITQAHEEAVAGIIVVVMLVGLILTVISIMQTVYIPKWMESREAEHMGIVEDQFSELKYAIDTQSIIRKTLPISTSITLGSKELGFLSSQRAFGRLAVEENATSLYFKLLDGTDHINQFGVLKYSSENSYFLDQMYVYEMGAVVLNQSQGAALVMKPLFTSYLRHVNWPGQAKLLTLNLTCITLIPIGGKTSISGYGTYPIHTQFVSAKTSTYHDVKWINLTTKYPSVWYQYFNDTLTYVHSPAPENVFLTPIIEYKINQDHNLVTMHFYGGILSVTINLNLITVDVQISPGWVG